jgi:DNA-directed RNA polymerase subunit RPC12/RpoP
MVTYKPVSDHNLQIPKAEHHEQPRGSWAPGKSEDRVVPIVRCLDCGGKFTLCKNHKIMEDGKVTPSIGCPWCGWHVFGRLLDWG